MPYSICMSGEKNVLSGWEVNQVNEGKIDERESKKKEVIYGEWYDYGRRRLSEHRFSYF